MIHTSHTYSRPPNTAFFSGGTRSNFRSFLTSTLHLKFYDTDGVLLGRLRLISSLPRSPPQPPQVPKFFICTCSKFSFPKSLRKFTTGSWNCPRSQRYRWAIVITQLPNSWTSQLLYKNIKCSLRFERHHFPIVLCVVEQQFLGQRVPLYSTILVREALTFIHVIEDWISRNQFYRILCYWPSQKPIDSSQHLLWAAYMSFEK